MVTVEEIQDHYDRLSPYYALFWGNHIHHGYWKKESESASRAQENLVHELVGFAGVQEGDRVLDVGCGLGGSSMMLASAFGCSTVGLSISAVQIAAACGAARSAALSERCDFLVADAARLPIRESAFDVVWSVECTEHIADKRALFSSLATLLKPGGRFAIAAWVKASDDALVDRVCRAFLCPNLGTVEQYLEWIPGARHRDITAHVLPTWKLCRAMAASSIVRKAASSSFAEFLDGFAAIDEAFRSGRMAYVLLAGSRGIRC
jgi:tocopherol O-methyltransferase